MTTRTPPFFWAVKPSVCIVHRSVSSGRLSSFGRVNSAMKSAKAYALIAVLGWYSMSNWLSSIAHWTILPVASGLFMDFLMGWFVITKVGFAWGSPGNMVVACAKLLLMRMKSSQSLGTWLLPLGKFS